MPKNKLLPSNTQNPEIPRTHSEALIDVVSRTVEAILKHKKSVRIYDWQTKERKKLPLKEVYKKENHWSRVKTQVQEEIHGVIAQSGIEGIDQKAEISTFLNNMKDRYNSIDRDTFRERYTNGAFMKDISGVLGVMYIMSAHGNKAMKDRVKISIHNPSSHVYMKSRSNQTLKKLLLVAKKHLSSKEYTELGGTISQVTKKMIKRFSREEK